MKYFLLALTFFLPLVADNQTDTLSTILPGDELPFTVSIEEADFQLQEGLQAYASGMHDGKWLFLCGRTNGLHGFGPGNHAFPKRKQNRTVFVIDPDKKEFYSRSLDDAQSGLTIHEVDSLSVTNPQSYQSKGKLYIAGGYGVNSETGSFSTKDTLSVIDMGGLIHWVMHPKSSCKASDSIRQVKNEGFRVTGGYMTQLGKQPTLLVCGQNFSGLYHGESTTGNYTKEIRRFRIKDDGKKLKIKMKDPKPDDPVAYLRRRDLNVVPIMKYEGGKDKEALVAYSGVFTKTNGIWTVPVEISASGSPFMADPDHAQTLKQGMNNYSSATAGLYSESSHDMYTILFGGLSYGFFEDGSFQVDDGVPFINQITTIKRSNEGVHTQYLMDATYPDIISQTVNQGNILLFGTGAYFFPVEACDVDQYDTGILKLDSIKQERTLIGYIVGGIVSSLPNTSDTTDSWASPYIFEVYITPK